MSRARARLSLLTPNDNDRFLFSDEFFVRERKGGTMNELKKRRIDQNSKRAVKTM